MSTKSLGERRRFLRSFLASPRQVGSVVPTSRHAVRAMLDLAPLGEARYVVEMGAGTGPHTREILPRLRADARLLAFEIDTDLAAGLARELVDPRLNVIAESAEGVEAHLDGARADVVVSALPFTSLPSATRRGLLQAARRILADDGVMLVLQYSPFMQAELLRTFGFVERRVTPLNVPPAFLFACRTAPAPSSTAPHS